MQIVEFKEKESSPCEVDCSFYLAVVKHSSIEDNPDDESIETEIPKVYLKLQTLIEFDTFVVTHGPFTSIDGKTCLYIMLSVYVLAINNLFVWNKWFLKGAGDSDSTEPGSLKRKGGVKVETPPRRAKQPAYFISELAHVVAMCDERLPFVGLATEVSLYLHFTVFLKL